jgi:hypothetical protein
VKEVLQSQFYAAIEKHVEHCESAKLEAHAKDESIEVMIDELESRSSTIDAWPNVNQIVDPHPLLPGPCRQTIDLPWPKWNRWQGKFRYTLPGPRLEARKASHNGRTLVAVLNHHHDEAVTSPVPFVDDQPVELLLSNSDLNDTVSATQRYSPETVAIYEIG